MPRMGRTCATAGAEAPYPPLPYGRAAFPSVRRDGCLYVDKTRFIRVLEDERYVFFVRPRRFGKTFWLATLECYYDRRQKDDFKALFADTDIGRAPESATTCKAKRWCRPSWRRT